MRTAALAGLLVRKERWGLSLRGGILALAISVLLAATARQQVLPFLSITQRTHSDFLVVEGWIPNYVINQVSAEFTNGQYHKLLLVRTFDVDEYRSDWFKGELVKQGVPHSAIETAFSPAVRKDRTYHLAVAVRDWFMKNGLAPKSLDIATLGPHARRSRLIFEKAFQNSMRIGIIALDDPAYDREYWWRSSEGVREVLGEIIAYLYARFYFVWA